jgi:hypothetical protein
MTMSRWSLFGLALLPVLPAPIPAKRSFLAPGHVVAEPALFVDSPTAFNEECRKLMRCQNLKWVVLSDSNRPEKPASAEIGMGR